MKTEWFTRSGAAYAARSDVKQFHVPMLGSPSRVVCFEYGQPYDINLDKGAAKYDYESTCGRCGGAGGGPQWSHTGWTCFQCGGSGKGGVKTGKLYTADRLAKLNAAQAKRDAKSAAKTKAAAEA